MRRIHVADIGSIAIQNDLSATRAIQPRDLPHSLALGHRSPP